MCPTLITAPPTVTLIVPSPEGKEWLSSLCQSLVALYGGLRRKYSSMAILCGCIWFMAGFSVETHGTTLHICNRVVSELLLGAKLGYMVVTANCVTWQFCSRSIAGLGGGEVQLDYDGTGTCLSLCWNRDFAETELYLGWKRAVTPGLQLRCAQISILTIAEL